MTKIIKIRRVYKICVISELAQILNRMLYFTNYTHAHTRAHVRTHICVRYVAYSYTAT